MVMSTFILPTTTMSFAITTSNFSNGFVLRRGSAARNDLCRIAAKHRKDGVGFLLHQGRVRPGLDVETNNRLGI